MLKQTSVYVLITIAVLAAPGSSLAQDAVADTGFSPMREAGAIAAHADAEPLWKRFVRDPRGAFVTSALVPGASEIISGNDGGYYFLGAEVLLWAGYITLTVLRNNNIDEYETSGDKYWSIDRYNSMTGLSGNLDMDPDTTFFAIESVPVIGTDDFYDFITRPQAALGWSDYTNTYDDKELPDVDGFTTARQKDMAAYYQSSENQREYLQYTMSAVVLNHLISAISAYRGARVRQQGVSMHFNVRDYNGEALPHAMLSYSF